MDLSTILVKLAGAALLIWTAFSIYKHLIGRKTKEETASKDENKPSVSEQVLNNVLLYLWLAFMVIFSSGMILNN